MTRILVTGSRDWPRPDIVERAITAELPDRGYVVVVHGACPTGADAQADEYATEWGIPVERHPADWAKYGRAAGPIRNKEMVDLGADVVLAFLMPDSRGTVNCRNLALRAGLTVKTHHLEGVQQ